MIDNIDILLNSEERRATIEIDFTRGTPKYVMIFCVMVTASLARVNDKLGAKNLAYGNSVARRGINGILIRMEDKINRIFNIMQANNDLSSNAYGVTDESSRDSIEDNLGYATIGNLMVVESDKSTNSMFSYSWSEIMKTAIDYQYNESLVFSGRLGEEKYESHGEI